MPTIDLNKAQASVLLDIIFIATDADILTDSQVNLLTYVSSMLVDPTDMPTVKDGSTDGVIEVSAGVFKNRTW